MRMYHGALFIILFIPGLLILSSCRKQEAIKGQVDTLFIEPGSPWENGYVESFNSRMRDELLNGELFLHIDETKYVVERWRVDYNHYRPHSSLSYMIPVSFTELCRQAGCVRPHTPVLDGV